MLEFQLHWFWASVIIAFALTGLAYALIQSVRGLRFLLFLRRGLERGADETLESLRKQMLSETDQQALARLDAQIQRAWKTLSPTRITDLAAVRQDCLALVQEIAAIYFPNSPRPELEVTPIELLRLNERVNRQLLGLIQPLDFLHHFSVHSILQTKNLFERTRDIVDSKSFKRGRSVFQRTWLAFNAMSPSYWVKRALFSGATQVANRRLLVSVYRIVGTEAIQCYRSSRALGLDPRQAPQNHDEAQPQEEAFSQPHETPEEQPAAQSQADQESESEESGPSANSVPEQETILPDESEEAPKGAFTQRITETLSRFLTGGLQMWEKWVTPDAILRRYQMRGHSVEAIGDIQALPIEAIETMADEEIRKGGWLSAAEGAATGVGGFLLMGADAVSIIALQIRTIQQVGYCFGFDVHRPEERLFTLKLLEEGYRHPLRKERSAIMNEMRMAIQLLNQSTPAANIRNRIMIHGLGKLAQTIGLRIGSRSVSRVVPVVGAVAGGYINRQVTRDIAEIAKMVYSERLRELRRQRGEDIPSRDEMPS
mgnify:CR=1 FL=1